MKVSNHEIFKMVLFSFSDHYLYDITNAVNYSYQLYRNIVEPNQSRLTTTSEWRSPGLNFINVLHTAFTHVDPECAKKDSQVSIVILRFWAPQELKLYVER